MAATMTMRPYSTPYSSWPQPLHQQMSPQHSTGMNANHVVESSSLSSSSQAQAQALVATGRKRKRLQRACVACHKAKRRCDGGLPCSNCDFSGRTCSYSDAQGKIVAPTKRTLKPSEAAMQEQQQQQHSMMNRGPPMPVMHHPSSSSLQQQSGPSPAFHSRASPSTGASYSHSPSADYSTSPRQHANPLPRIEPNLETRRELLCIFFSHLQPLSSILDEISFLRDLASNEVPWVLLFAMYAVSAEYANDVHQQQLQHSPLTASNGNGSIIKYSRVVTESGNGSKYASEARKLLYSEDERTGQSMIDGMARVEVAQALALLAFYEFGQRRYFRASSYIQLSSKHVSALSSQGPLIHHDSGAFVSRNAKRLACLLTTMDVSMSMMSGQSMSTRAINIDGIIETPRSGSPKPEEDQETSALMHLRNVSLILNSALEVRVASRSSSSNIEEQIRRCEQELHHWADELPRRLQYDQGRLQSVSQLLNSSRASSPSSSMAPMTRSTAVCWSMMHTVAETTTLILKQVNGNTLDRAKGALAACNNISILLEQSNPAALPKLFAALGVSVLYSVTSSIAKSNEERDWTRVCEMARSFANFAHLGDSIWSSMASWWWSSTSTIQLQSPSSLHQRHTPPPPLTSSEIFKRPISSSPKMAQHRSTSISQHRPSITSPSSNYHYLPPLGGLGTTLPPLRMPSISSSSSDHHHHHHHNKRPSWENHQQQQQPSIRSLTVDL